MSDTLIQKIEQDAAAEIAEIKAAGTAKVEAIQRETDMAVVALKENYLSALKKRQSQNELVAVSKAKQAGKIALQGTKRSLINDLFAETQTALVEQDSSSYTAFFGKNAASILPKSITVVKVTAPTARLEETKDILTMLGLSGEVVADTHLKAGFILHALDGVYDITLDRLVGEKRALLEMEIVRKLLA
ncbi:hypothetical protein GW937_01980 [Candidatus Kaiserbacteria bacterium]|nr:hypothetical protein [Candidatus Kaiserbacteria bacterium]NCT02190.1 hypothetical protein [Candidatus Parcubacteria bacterium]